MQLRPEENERLNRLVQRIKEETNHVKFTALVQELNDLLDRKQQRIDPIPQKPKVANSRSYEMCMICTPFPSC